MKDFNWKELYANKIVSADEALSHIKAGDRIFIGTGCAAPQALIEGLCSSKRKVADAEIFHLITMGPAPYARDNFADKYRFNSFFIGENVREAVNNGVGDYTPVSLSEIPNLFSRGRTPLDVALIQVTPPDENRMVSLGISVDIVKSATENASMVIAEINPNMPWTHGDSLIPADYIDYFVESNAPILTYKSAELDDTIRRIGSHVASLIEDGSTIEIGLGSIPQSMPEFLYDKKDLGIHTEMFTDQLVDLIEKGAVNGSKKLYNKGKVVASFIMGTKKVYDYVNRNPMIEMHPSEYVNDPVMIAKHPKMVAINYAMEVDLTGQVCADSLGNKFYSGIGGQSDFMRGAGRSDGGKPIIVIKSTSKDGQISRIVPNLSTGAGVVTTRGDVHYVVTEYGIADLYGKNIRERAMALIGIAHPKFRASLYEEARKLKYVYDDPIDVSLLKEEYPDKYSQRQVIADGTEVTLRPIRPTDESALRDMFYSLSEESIYLRFFQPVDALPHAKVLPLVSINYKKDMAVVSTIQDSAGEKIIGVGRYMRGTPDDKYAEVAFLVRDAWQNRGLGKALLDSLIDISKQHGVEGFKATVIPKNKMMISVFRGCGCNLHMEKNGDVYELKFKFDEKA